MQIRYLARWVGCCLLALLVLRETPADAVKLRVCRQRCEPSIATTCAGLKKGKLKKCRKRLWKACKRDVTACQLPTTTTQPVAPPTTTTRATVTTTTGTATTTSATVTTTTAAVTTSTTLAEPFAGSWRFHGETTSACGLDPTYNDGVTIGVYEGELSAAVDSIRDRVFPGTKNAEGDLVLASTGVPLGPCFADVVFTLDGPVSPSTPTTGGSVSLSIACAQCEVVYTGSFQRIAAPVEPSAGLGALDGN